MPIEAVNPRRLYRQVADQLRQLIDNGEFAVGSRLPTERDLAAQLCISRPTVREALIALEVDGRVSIRGGSGIYVLPPPAAPSPAASISAAGPFELLNARALFEGAVAEDAARHSTPATMRAVDEMIAAMEAAEHPGPQSMELDRAFHIAVADMLGNDAVTKVVGDLFDQRINPYFKQLASYFENAGSWNAALREHKAIRDRLAARDAAGAASAMRNHLQNSQKRFSESFGKGLPPMPKAEGRPRASASRATTEPHAHAVTANKTTRSLAARNGATQDNLKTRALKTRRNHP
jgi:DNA-binding FadR family transcriptional regulator